MNSDAILTQILAQVQALQVSQQALAAKVETLQPSTTTSAPIAVPATTIAATTSPSPLPPSHSLDATSISTSPPPGTALTSTERKDKEREKVLYPGRVLLTTYPDQHGIQPYPLTWFSPDPSIRGPIICSRLPSSIKRRNAIGAHSGSYSIYRALSIGMGTLDPAHRPDYSMTAPPVEIPPNEAWWTPGKIVSFDPWGHLVPQVYGKQIRRVEEEEGGEGLDVRPSIAVTRAHIKLSEIDEAVRRGEIEVDGKIVLKSAPMKNEDGTVNEKIDPGVEVAVSKAAVEPVWYLPGVAERFGISETLLRRALFEETGGMYPELITRPDIKVFLPPIGNLTVYIFGNPSLLSSPTAHLTLRVHDECNGSDVFGSDICTCKPYLTYAMEECIRTAQGKQEDMVRDGKTEGVGVVVYFRKEGRALGEVTKYLVYNLRKRAGDSADKYFQSTEIIAGVKDMRHQALMPDVLHWLGIKKVDGMVSMSDMKYDAVVGSGIGIGRRYDLPDHLIPPDSRVEIDAKIASGYFSSRTGEKGMGMTQEELRKTVGRGWEEVEH